LLKADSGTNFQARLPNMSGTSQEHRLNLRIDALDPQAALGSKYRAPSDSRRRKLPMRYARILSIGLVATVAFAWSAAAVENAHELVGYCQSLALGAKGAGRQIYIPRTREALTCWGYMRAMQDLSVLADEEGHRIMGACPPEQTTTLQLIRSFVRYARAHRMSTFGVATDHNGVAPNLAHDAVQK
jgi:hypothetical protein